jgi:hypothetical protein
MVGLNRPRDRRRHRRRLRRGRPRDLIAADESHRHVGHDTAVDVEAACFTMPTTPTMVTKRWPPEAREQPLAHPEWPADAQHSDWSNFVYMAHTGSEAVLAYVPESGNRKFLTLKSLHSPFTHMWTADYVLSSRIISTAPPRTRVRIMTSSQGAGASTARPAQDGNLTRDVEHRRPDGYVAHRGRPSGRGIRKSDRYGCRNRREASPRAADKRVSPWIQSGDKRRRRDRSALAGRATNATEHAANSLELAANSRIEPSARRGIRLASTSYCKGRPRRSRRCPEVVAQRIVAGQKLELVELEKALKVREAAK